MSKYTREELLQALTDFYEETGKVPTTADFCKAGIKHKKWFKDEFGSWNNAIQEAGFDIASTRSRDRIKCECGNCGKEIEAYPSELSSSVSGKVFCSRSCSALYNNKQRPEISKITKEKISNSMKLAHEEGRAHKRIKNDNKIPKLPNIKKSKTTICINCNKSFVLENNSRRKCCSAECDTNHRKKVCGGYRPGAGKSKDGWYKGSYWCDSTYELIMVIYWLDHGKVVERNKDFWEYVNVDGEKHKYYPDYRVDGVLYEIKGPQRENDLLKLAAVDEPIVYLQGKSGIKPYSDYVFEKYNVDLTTIVKLYDDHRHEYKHVCQFCGKEFFSIRKNAKCCSNKCGRERGTKRKLSKEQALEIYYSHKTPKELEQLYNVNKTTIYEVKTKRSYKWIHE